MSTQKLIDMQEGTGEDIDPNQQDEPNLETMGLDESEDVDLLNEDYDDITEIESHNVEDNLDDLQALIGDTQNIQEDNIKPVDFERKPEAQTVTRKELIDDFIRNFFIKNNLNKSLEAFQQEWYEVAQKGKINLDEVGRIPDVYIQNQKLEEQVQKLQKDLNDAKMIAEKAKGTWDQLKKEKQHHRMHHKRVLNEKKALNDDINKLKNLHTIYEQKYQELSTKYEAAMKEKMLVKMDRDRLLSKTEALNQTIQNLEERFNKDKDGTEVVGDDTQNATSKSKKKDSTLKKTRPKTKKFTPIPEEDNSNPYLTTNFDPFPTKNVTLTKSFKGHLMPISSITVHPRKSFIATASDDRTWKIWGIPNGELIMSGEGHSDWVSGLSFDPQGTHLATCSGDSTVKVWDFVQVKCAATFKDHIHPVWDIDFHHTGKFIVTASMDHSSKLLDVNAQKSRNTFRGHVDSVNCVNFLPFSNIFASASADKTVSLWDIRSGLCVQTFYGHLNSVNSVDPNCRGEALATCDADGIVKIWDIRMVKERDQIDVGPYSANDISWDKSCTTLAVACDDSMVRLINDEGGEARVDSVLKGHTDTVQGVVFDYESRTLISAGSDAEFKIWS